MTDTNAKLIIKANADKGNTVLFRTADTGGALQISVDGVQWFTIGEENKAEGSYLYDFVSPLAVTANREVHLRLAVSDNIAPGEYYKVVAVGGTTNTIGFNLLPSPLSVVKGLFDDSGIVIRSRLPSDVVYKSDGAIPDAMLPSYVARWDSDSKLISKDNLPEDIAYTVNGLIPTNLLPTELFDIWEDYTDGMLVQAQI